jgi:hypothetical protein
MINIADRRCGRCLRGAGYRRYLEKFEMVINVTIRMGDGKPVDILG